MPLESLASSLWQARNAKLKVDELSLLDAMIFHSHSGDFCPLLRGAQLWLMETRMESNRSDEIRSALVGLHLLKLSFLASN